MINTPDFVSQVRDVEQDMGNEWHSVTEGWRDKVAQNFGTTVMEPYMMNFQQYVTGDGITGYGLMQLLQQMENHMRKMDSLAEY